MRERDLRKKLRAKCRERAEKEEDEEDIAVMECVGVNLEECQNLDDSYGEICVKCNKCGRYDE